MKTQYNQPDYRGQVINVGMDLGKTKWVIGTEVGGVAMREFTQGPDPEQLAKHLRRNYPGGTYRCVYEAGYDGFWVQKALEKEGIECIVVNAADVPTTDKEKKVKTNRIDCRKLVRGLSRGELTPIYVPSDEELNDRSLVRLRGGMVRKQTRCKNQIKAHLQFYGIRRELDDPTERYWSRRYIAWIEEVQRANNDAVLETLLGELAFLRKSILTITRKMRALARADRHRDMMEYLLSVSGVGFQTAMAFETEVHDINRFCSFDKLASFIGLVPGEDSTGDDDQKTGITPRHNRQLRRLLVEAAWVAIRDDPTLLEAYLKLTKRMKKNRAIIRIARKILSRIRFVMKNRQPYRALEGKLA